MYIPLGAIGYLAREWEQRLKTQNNMKEKETTGRTGPNTPLKKGGDYYWIRCWERRKLLRKRQYYYSFMHSNGKVLATSEGINSREHRDAVVRGLMEHGIEKVLWEDAAGEVVTQLFSKL
jgi:uncharacterized protein YegP (UPF0339 family)